MLMDYLKLMSNDLSVSHEPSSKHYEWDTNLWVSWIMHQD